MSNQENIKKLSELHDQAFKLIEEYNKIAEAESYETRIGIIDASFDLDNKKYEMACDTLENDEEPSQELIDSMIVDINSLVNDNNDYDARPYWTTQFPGTKERCWRPSGINC